MIPYVREKLHVSSQKGREGGREKNGGREREREREREDQSERGHQTFDDL
jgi:hypothetical protein